MEGRQSVVQRSVTLYCFAHAGGSATSYVRWKRQLPAWLTLEPVELPGHGSRIGEPLETQLPRMVEAAQAWLLPRLRTPFALFGHSMGSAVAFELACRLRETAAPEPLVLFASGADAPSRRDHARYAQLTSDHDLRAELARLDGTPDAALASEELMEFALPVLRADFQACAGYRCPVGRRIGSPIHVFGGTEDSTTAATLEAWGEHTTATHTVEMFSGGHFFIREHEPELLRRIVARITSLLPSHSPSSAASVPSAGRGVAC